MGIERTAITAKLSPENVLWLHAMVTNEFVGVSISGLLNILVTWARLANASGSIKFSPNSVKRYLVHGVYAAEPKWVSGKSENKRIA